MDNKDFTTLEVWKSSHKLILGVYRFCKTLPKDETYNLISQLKRSASSNAANIAEGYGRYYYQDNISFCRKARGSLYETRNHLLQAKSLEFGDQSLCNELIDQTIDTGKILNGYIRHLNLKKPGKE